MEYNSFYGGRRGASFTIVKSFSTVQDMAQNFRNSSYSTVKFDQYVIIDTNNKNNPDNGKIFKRGYGFNSGKTIQWYNESTGRTESIDAGGAEYIGKIGGSTGTTPQLILSTYTDVLNKRQTQNWQEQRNTGSYSLANANLVPGKSGNTFNDTIDWCSLSMRDPDLNDAIAYIGFKVPYLINDFITEQVEPYNNSGNYADMSSAQREDDGTHPFYHKWKVKIPKGIKGDSLRNLRLIVPTNQMSIFTPGTTTLYPNFADDVTNHRQILVYDYYVFDEKNNPTPITYYLGAVNSITGLSVDEHGGLTVNYSGIAPTVYPNMIRWIDEIIFNKDIQGNNSPGHLIIKYNTLDENNNQQYVDGLFDYVKGISFADDGTITVEKVQSGNQTLSEKAKWIDDISLNTTHYDTNEGKMTISYNTGDDFVADLKWVNGLQVGSNGTLILKYAGGGSSAPVKDSNNNNVVLRYIDSISLDTTQGGADQGKLIVNYNTGTNPFTANLKWVNDIIIQDNGDITLKYSGQGQNKTATHKLKYVKTITLSNIGNMVATYNDNTTQTLQTGMKWINNISFANGVLRFTYNTQTVTTGTNDYQDFSLNYPNDIQIASNGAISVGFANGTSLSRGTLKSLTNLTIDPVSSRLYATYNTNQEEYIGSPLNYIQSMVIDQSNNHLLVFYSDPLMRGSYIYNNLQGWTDLGYLFSGVNIDQRIQTFANQNITIESGDEVIISHWSGIGIMTDNSIECSIPLKRIVSVTNPNISLQDGEVEIYYKDAKVADFNILTTTTSLNLSNVGLTLNMAASGFSWISSIASDNPVNYSIMGVKIDNLSFTV